MKFPLSLLKMFLKTEASLAEIAATATAIGLEVDAIEDKSAALKPFVVAEILHAEKHPQADKLQVCKVRAAQGELQIVCGAPNARAGIKVALANIGTLIPTNQMEIKAAKVRGVESQGMMCSARELGLGEDHAGIIELPLDAAIGKSIVEILGLDDPILDLNITANRGDCMGVAGIARDLAAAGLGEFVYHQPPAIAGEGATYDITLEDAGCPMFYGRVVRGLRNGQSPEWLQRTLTAAGMRPISALVDATNFGTLAYGRPSHVYDLSKLKGAIVVRPAREGETLLALNDKTYTLSPRDLVIADDSGAIGLAGIMGGKSTSVDAATTDILIEVALFDPLRIAATGRALQIDSDARTRFERGVDLGGLEMADHGITGFIQQLCGGTAGPVNMVGKAPEAAAPIAFDPAFINGLNGVEVPEARQIEILTRLGFRHEPRTTNHEARFTPPSWRHDCSQPADLAEEVLRIVGYDAIPLTPLPKAMHIAKPALDSAQGRASLLRRVAASRGLHETYSWGFCSKEQAAAWGGQAEALELLNPISADLSVMRPKILPHLVEAVRTNLARGIADIALFELGATFHDTTPEGQKTVLSGLRVGNRAGLHWAETKPVDVYDVKADLFALLDAAGINTAQLMVMLPKDAPWFHPGRSGVVGLGPKNLLGSFGELHPSLLKQFGVEVPVYAFALFVSALPGAKAAKRKPLVASDYQATTRDFAFVVEASLPASELVKHINAAEKTLLREVTIFDVYQGKGMEPGKKSIALSITLQAADRTLTEAEIEAASSAILANVKKVGASLRA